jgi:hypothetical protein
MRYAAVAEAHGGRVALVCPEPLVPLAQSCPGVHAVIPSAEPLPEFDVHSPLMRLMCLFTKTEQAIPARNPYLRAEVARVDRWRARMAAWPGLKVGIAWQGNPKHARDRDRSFSLAQFERLASLKGVHLVSLQKRFGVEQLKELSGRFPVVDLGDDVDADSTMIQDTPAVMMNLDLVITPDTMVAHLAGALGVPVWITLAKSPDWRWLLGRDDSPWYPTARLFRQPDHGRWDLVFDRIAAALEAKIASRGQTLDREFYNNHNIVRT